MTEPVSIHTLRGASPGQWVPLGTVGGNITGTLARTGSGSLGMTGVKGGAVDTFLWGFQQFPVDRDEYLHRAGYNTANPYTGSAESGLQQHNRAIANYGRNDIVKLFYSGNLPTTWNAQREGSVPATTIAMVCHNQGGGNLQGTLNVANGLLDDSFRTYTRSVPADRTAYLVYNQEADSSLTDGGLGGVHYCSKAQYVAAFNRLAQVLHDDKAAGNTAPGVFAHANFMNAAFRQGVWTDDRVPNKADHISWDTYLNPTPGTGKPLIISSAAEISSGNLYENASISASIFAANHAAAAARILDEFGVSYAGRWGWAEIGAPFRSADVPANTGRPEGAKRADAFRNLLNELKAAGAYFGIIWDSDVGQWDHRLLSPATSPTLVLKTNGEGWNPAIVPSPNQEPAIAVIRGIFGT